MGGATEWLPLSPIRSHSGKGGGTLRLEAASGFRDATPGSGRVEEPRVVVGVAGRGSSSRQPWAVCALPALSKCLLND